MRARSACATAGGQDDSGAGFACRPPGGPRPGGNATGTPVGLYFALFMVAALENDELVHEAPGDRSNGRPPHPTGAMRLS